MESTSPMHSLEDSQLDDVRPSRPFLRLAVVVCGCLALACLAVVLFLGHSTVASAQQSCPVSGSNDTWTGNAGDGMWSTLANWTNGVPGTASNDNYPCIAGSPTVSFTAGTTAISAIAADGATLNVSGGELEVGNDATSTLGALNLSGGVVSGAGTIELEGSSNWSGGTIGDPALGRSSVTTVVVTAGTLALPSGGQTLAQASLSISEGAALTIDTTLEDSNGSTIANSGTVDFLDGQIAASHGGTFSNTGTVEMTGSGTAWVHVPYVSTAGSTAAVSGTLRLVGGSAESTDTAPFTIAAGATLSLGGEQFLGPAATVTGTGSGRLELQTGVGVPIINFAGSVDVPGGVASYVDATFEQPLGSSDTNLVVEDDTLTLDAASVLPNVQMYGGELVVEQTLTAGIDMARGTIAGPGTVYVTGLDRIDDEGYSTQLGDPGQAGGPTTFDIIGGAGADFIPVLIDGADFEVSPGATVSTYDFFGGITVENGGEITNLGTLDLAGTGGTPIANGGNAGTFTNAGTVSGTSVVSIPYVSTGTTEGGTLAFTDGSGGGTDTGPFIISSGGSLMLAGDQTLGIGATITGKPSATIDFGSGTISVAAAVNMPGGVLSSGDVTLDEPLGKGNTLGTGNPLTVTGGELVLESNSTTPLFALEGGTLAGPGTLRLTYAARWIGGTIGDPALPGVSKLDLVAGSLGISGDTVLDHADIDVGPGSVAEVYGGTNLTAEDKAAIKNAGTLDISGNATVANGGHAAGVTNTGELETTGSGDLATIDVPYNDTGGSTNVDAGSLEFSGGGPGTTLTGGVVASGATLELRSPKSAVAGLTGAGTLVLDAGTMSLSGENSIGTFTQSGGTYEVTFTGGSPGSGFGQLTVSAGYSLSGTLAVLDGPGFTPATGDYTLISGATGTGTFATTSFPSDGNTYALEYNPTSLVLDVT